MQTWTFRLILKLNKNNKNQNKIKRLNKKMEIKLKIKREEGPTRIQNMRYFKIPLCRNFV